MNSKRLLYLLILFVGLAGSDALAQEKQDSQKQNGVQVIITQSPKIIVDVVDVAHNKCSGESKGSIDINAQGGYPPYKYYWAHGDTTQDVASLKAGLYRVAVYDGFSCSDTVEVEIKEPELLKASIENVKDILCYGYNNGEVNISVRGGVAPYRYSWNTGATTQNLTGVTSGRYSVLITDANNCQEITTADVAEKPLIVRSVDDIKNILCNGDPTGSVDITVNGGVPPYSYMWSNGETNEDLHDLPAGSYDVTVKDAEGCTEVSTTKVIQPDPLQITFGELRNLSCNGDFGGAINIDVFGGTQPYKYQWNNGATSQDIAGIPAGKYEVTIVDRNGCRKNENTEITEPIALSASMIDSRNVSFFGGEDGKIDIEVGGGVGPYSYKWSNESVAQNISNLKAGNYSVRITDATGCTKMMNVTIDQPMALSVSIDNTRNILCYGENTGEINVSVMGGVPPYQYNWNNGASTQDIEKIPAGEYKLTVTDANGRQRMVDTTLLQPPSFKAAILSTTNILCNSAWTGAIDLGVEGGVLPYKYRWTTGFDEQDLIDVPSGKYSVKITDANHCEQNVDVEITEPEPLEIAFENIEHIKCSGENTGSISITVAGGAGDYSFSWSNGATTQNVKGIGAGVYSVQVTDVNGCTKEISTTINQPELLTVAEKSSSNIDCFGNASGFISLNVAGGVTPYQFEWSNGAKTQDITGLVAGNYSVNVTDNNGCKNALSKTLTEPQKLTKSLDLITNINCFNEAKGAVNISVDGGVQPYKYKWSNGAITQDIIDVKAGNYTVLLQDANGCIDSLSASVKQNAELITTYNITNILCNGDPTGAIDLTVQGGVEPYKYLWSNKSESQDLKGLTAGNYSVSITDGVGCAEVVDLQVTEPPKFVASLESEQNILCFGDSTGNISIRISGGVAPYGFQWNNGSQTQNLVRIPAGNYDLLATDANKCVQKISTSIEEPSKIVYSVNHVDNVLCYGDNGGAVDITISGGVGPYAYAWSNSSTSQDLERVPAGKYNVQIKDANNCRETLSAEVTQPAQLNVAISSIENILCFGELKGAIDIAVAGGVTPYSFSWSNGATTEDISDVKAGNYSVTVTDAQGCMQTINATIAQPPQLDARISNEKHLACFGDSNGAISIEVKGGVKPYTYAWSNKANTQNIENLVAGDYSVAIVDKNGCSRQLSTKIIQPEKLVSSLTGSKDVSCYEGSDGEVNITVNGGTTPYRYNWNNETNLQDLIGVVAGNYSVGITDAMGCKDSITSVKINQPTLLDVQLVSVTDILSYGKNTGSIDISVSGGIPEYAYSWSNGTKSQDLSSVPGGNYSVKVVDANGCEQIVNSVINQPPPFVVTLASVDDILCYGNHLGNININVEGGAPPYQYAWSNGYTTKDIDNVPAGNYSVRVTDANGNIAELSTKIAQPNQITTQFDHIQNLSCFNDQTGSISITVTGGVSPYKYEWNTGQTTQDLTNLAAGTYTITITDANVCVKSVEATVTQPEQFVAEIAEITDINCNSESEGGIVLDVHGGVRPYSYLWNNGEKTKDISGVIAGDYSVKLFDANGCTNELSQTITEPEKLITELVSVTNNKCFGENDGAVEISVRGGVEEYGFLWSNGATSQNINSLTSGSYEVEVTDANGCVGIVEASVNEPSLLTSEVLDITHVKCFGDNTGAINVSVSGGTSPYEYLWSNNATSLNIDNVKAGAYTFKVIDDHGCESDFNTEIAQPDLLSLELDTVYHVLCNGENTGFIDINVKGGVFPYKYSWNNGSISEDIVNVLSGTYSVKVQDANACEVYIETEIRQPDELLASMDELVDVECAGNASGLVTINAKGGVGPYNYKWNSGQETNTIENMPAGNYMASVTDANGCLTTFRAAISEPQKLFSNIDAITNIRCYGENSGSINVTVMKGTAPYTFEWSNGATTEDIRGVAAGDYKLKITEANGCASVLEGTIEEPTEFVASIDRISDIFCYGDSTGSIDVSVSGGVKPYSFAWSNGFETQSIRNVVSDNYSVMITDGNGCIKTLNGEITQPQMLALRIDSVYNVKCCGDRSGAIFISVDGGIEPYQYQWSNGATTQDIKDLVLGVYTVSVKDANNCEVSSLDDMTLYEQVVSQGKFTTRDIFFDVAKAVIKPESFTTINKIATFMKEHMDISFSIDGHTDSDGAADFNQKLSEDRSIAIKNALIKFGIRESRLKTRGFGEERPVATNATSDGKAKNRRVEFVVLNGTLEGTLVENESSVVQ
jgi:outer membrane protein OmpA-like peptidoglycan-associated protein/uncharacterized protein (DUF2141 family)